MGTVAGDAAALVDLVPHILSPGDEHRNESLNADVRAALERASLDPRAGGKNHHMVAISEDSTIGVVPVTNLSAQQRRIIVDKLMGEAADQDTEAFLTKIRLRMDRVGIELSQVEVRFSNLQVVAEVQSGKRGNTNILNAYRNAIEGTLRALHLIRVKKQKLEVLKGVSGTLHPRRITLLLGPPSSGKSTLMKALAGKLKHEHVQMEGNITYNGKSFDEFVVERTAAYVEQVDEHIGALTVRETLDFAARCQGVGHKEDELLELRKREKELGLQPDWEIDAFMKAEAHAGGRESIVTEYVLRLLGLDVCADTLVGDAMTRGISGGQRKRVTTGEMIVGPKKTLFMDAISTGLDSNTTYQIVKSMRNFAHLRDATVLIALLQPAPEVYDLFDDIMLLSEGRIVFHGPREEVIPFFSSLGFACPERKGVPDFLQEVTSRNDQAQYWVKKDVPHQFMSVEEMGVRMQQSPVGEKNAAHLATPFVAKPDAKEALIYTRSALTPYGTFQACMRREFILLKRNWFLYTFRCCQVNLMAIVTGTAFLHTQYSIDFSGGTLVMGCLFFSLIILFFDGITEETFTILRLPIFFKQRNNLFFQGWAYSLPVTFMRLPYSAVQAIMWSCITYYSIGLAPEAGRFFTFMLTLFVAHQMGMALFRAIGSIARDAIVGSVISFFTFLIMMMLGGFLLKKDDIHKWWVWGYYISPMNYAQRAILINEFLAPRWDVPYLGTTLGRSILASRGVIYDQNWIWWSLLCMIGFTILFLIIDSVCHNFLSPLRHTHGFVPEEEVEGSSAQKIQRTSISAKPDVEMAALARPLVATSGDVQLEAVSEARPVTGKQLSGSFRRPSGGLSSFRKSTSIDLPGETLFERLSRKNMGSAVSVPGLDDAPTVTKGMVLPFQPLSMTFSDVHYFVPLPAEADEKLLIHHVSRETGKPELELLAGISGAFRPKILTALVGVSGAGKTTLMDVLSGRKTTGRISGDIRVAGHQKVQATFARISGYVEQFDVHTAAVTVEESLLFSARLRFTNDVDDKTVEAFVSEVMELVELESLAKALVGLPGIDGLSVEQRKRLTIAVELVANPSIIFMDEPTSGLDARAAAIVMRTVRNTVNTGRTVVCTIHQPSIDIFEAFDELLLLKRGGQTIYMGPLGRQSHILVTYLQAVPGVPAIKDKINPATWMLEVTSPGAEERLGVDFAQVYASSTICREMQKVIAAESIPKEGSKPLVFDTDFAQSHFHQFLILLRRNFSAYWKMPSYNSVRFFAATGIGLIFGSIFWGLGKKPTNASDVFNVAGALYSSVLFLGAINARTVQSVASEQRTVFYRERAAGMYAVFPFTAAQAVVEVPYNIIQVCIYSVITYFMVGFARTAAKFFWYAVFMCLTLFTFTFYGMMTIALTPALSFAAIVFGLLLGFWNLFSGFIIFQPLIPGWWIWCYYINPVAWALYGIISSQLGDYSDISAGDGIVDPYNNNQVISISQLLENMFGYHHDMIGYVALILVGFAGSFCLVCMVALKRLNFQNR